MDDDPSVELLGEPQLKERLQRTPGGLLGTSTKHLRHTSPATLSSIGARTSSKKGFQIRCFAPCIVSPSVSGAQDRFLLGINHYAGSATFDVEERTQT